MIDLIILDLYGTIALATSFDNTPRNGFNDFLERNKDKKLVLATDVPSEETARGILAEQGVASRFDKIYTGYDLIPVRNYPGRRKNLRQICSDFNFTTDQAVFIGDGAKDREDARRDNVRFIHVPKYLCSDEPFSFYRIDLSKQLSAYTDMRNKLPVSFIK